MLRFAGYLGLVLFIGGSALRVLEPATRRGESSAARDVATGAAVVGFGLILGRLGDLAANSERFANRVLARVALVGMFTVFLGLGFLGVALLLGSPGTA